MPVEKTPALARRNGAELRAFITRMHFYVGLFVGPFVLVAAITGTLFVLTPQIETALYADQLRAETSGPPQSLEVQARAARAYIGEGPRLFAIRPAPKPGETTRVMFAEAGLGDSESRAIFIDPSSLKIQGDLIVYGTSGNLPLRTAIDYLHRHLMLGEPGRIYSELAASWLWIAAFGGVLLWAWSPRRDGRFDARRLHSTIGISIALGLIFLSITGLTWSKWAGDRIDRLRDTLGWVTPSVAPGLDHADHASHATGPAPASDPIALLDAVHAAARKAGIDSSSVEIRPAKSADTAWIVREYDRSWPTQVDTLAIDPRAMTVVSRADFAEFPLIAKLIRWGIDAHMGVLFGLPNQLVLASLGIALSVSILLGYAMWWRRRPGAGAMPLSAVWARLSVTAKVSIVAVAAALGWALPVMGASLAGFLLVDKLRWRRRSRYAPSA